MGIENGQIAEASQVRNLSLSHRFTTGIGGQDLNTITEVGKYTASSFYAKNAPMQGQGLTAQNLYVFNATGKETNSTGDGIAQLSIMTEGANAGIVHLRVKPSYPDNQPWTTWAKFWTSANATRDSNGFLKAASPIVDLYDDHIELNHDAKRQGGINFEKVSIGNYLVKGSLGFAQESWYIEMPKDANGNVLVAVVYEQLENNDISIKTYDYMLNKKGRIVPDTETPLDIPEGRCINLRLHEVKEQLNEPIE